MKVFGINNFKEENANIIEANYPMQNVLNVLGWFPIVGTVVGWIRIGKDVVLIVSDDDSNKSCHKKYYAVSIVRGVVETFSLGFFMIIPDIITSLTLKRKLKKELKKSKKEKDLSGVIEL